MAQVLITDTKLDNLAQAVSNKSGVTLPLTIDEMATAVAGISTGGITPTGTIPITQNGTYDITNYASANVNVQPTLQSKTYTPTASGTTITPDNGNDGLSSVIINGDANLTANNIKHGVNIFGTTGTFGAKIDSVTTTLSSRELSISFSGLKGTPLAFCCTEEGQTTFSKSYRWIISVTYDGTTVRNETHGVSGSSMIGYTFTNCTYTYSNGTLTITSPSSGSNGYFKDGMLHRLLYIYEE